MVKNICNKIMKNIATSDEYSKDQLEQMGYALVTLTFELMKSIFLIVIFTLLGYFYEIMIVSVIMCAIKPFIGGYHEETQIKCFIATVLFSAGILILNLQCSLTFTGNCILLFLCIFCIWNQAPIINSKMPITRPELIRKNRVRGLCTSVFFGVLSIALYNYYSSYSTLITWTILFEAILMFNKRES